MADCEDRVLHLPCGMWDMLEECARAFGFTVSDAAAALIYAGYYHDRPKEERLKLLWLLQEEADKNASED